MNSLLNKLIILALLSIHQVSYATVTPERTKFLIDTVLHEYQNEISQLQLPLAGLFCNSRQRSSECDSFQYLSRGMARIKYINKTKVAERFEISLSYDAVYSPSVSDDTVLWIICHELGHILAGAPYSSHPKSDPRYPTSAEGKADYFAAGKCLKRVFKKIQRQEGALQFEASQEFCANDSDSAVCERVMNAILTSQLENYGGDLSDQNRLKLSVFEILQPDKLLPVKSTNLTQHPNKICRIKTSMVALRCDADIYSSKTCDEDFQAGGGLECWYKPAN